MLLHHGRPNHARASPGRMSWRIWRGCFHSRRHHPGLSTLNASYVSNGVDRFVTGQYAAGHEWGFMLGYVLALPVDTIVQTIDDHLKKSYGKLAKLAPEAAHALSLAILEGALAQKDGHTIRMKHIFVDMTSAA